MRYGRFEWTTVTVAVCVAGIWRMSKLARRIIKAFLFRDYEAECAFVPQVDINNFLKFLKILE